MSVPFQFMSGTPYSASQKLCTPVITINSWWIVNLVDTRQINFWRQIWKLLWGYIIQKTLDLFGGVRHNIWSVCRPLATVVSCNNSVVSTSLMKSAKKRHAIFHPKDPFSANLQRSLRQYRRLTEFGPPMWQAEAESISSLSASPATAMGQILLVWGGIL